MPQLARLALAAATLFCLIALRPRHKAPAQVPPPPSPAPWGTASASPAVRRLIAVGLEDVTRQDAPARVVSEMTFPVSGKQVPIPFQLPYGQADIDPSTLQRAPPSSSAKR